MKRAQTKATGDKKVSEKEGVMLVYPPFELPQKNKGKYLTTAPLGISYIAASLEGCGIKTHCIDCNTEGVNILDEAIRFQPKIIGFYTTSVGLRFVYSKIRELRGRGLTSTIIVGGPQISSDIKTAKKLDADAYFIGEVENELPRYYNRVEDCKKVSGKVISCGEIDDLNSIPHPRRESFNARYHYTSFCASRGCPFKCIYCAMAGTKHRKREMEDIDSEVDEIKRGGVKHIEIIDDSFTIEQDFAIDVSEVLSKHGMNFNCTTRADLIEEETLVKMKNNGLNHINFGVETGDEQTRELIGKNISDRDIFKAFSLCRKHGIKTTAYAVIGGPWESRDTIKKTFDFIYSLKPDDIMSSPLILHPGTKAHQIGLEDNVIGKDSWEKYMLSNAPIPTYPPKDMSPEDVAAHIFNAEKKFYLKPGRIMKRIMNSKEPGELITNVFAAAAYLMDFKNN
jgi:anaerobic magnesium-protoporphyrin IX monomethyl ester cyclase